MRFPVRANDISAAVECAARCQVPEINLNMKSSSFAAWIAIVLLFALTGCVLISRIPPELGPIKLIRVPSPSVEIQWCTIERQAAGPGFVVRGYVVRRSNARGTMHTRLHLRFLDAQGHLLREELGGFVPSDIKERMVRGQPVPYARFDFSFLKAPAGTVEIEIRAQDASENTLSTSP